MSFQTADPAILGAKAFIEVQNIEWQNLER
jgi:hypothetical protein